MIYKQINNIRILVTAEEEYSPDLSWDDTGEIGRAIRDGVYDVFVAKVSVQCHCPTCGEWKELQYSYLRNCIYKDLNDFARNSGHMRSMVSDCVNYYRQEQS